MSSEKALPKIITEDPGELNIGIDLDGVVANISSEVRKMVLEGLGIDASLAGNRKNSRGPQFVLGMWDNPALYEAAEQIPGAVDTINEWRTHGFQIWFITARTKNSVGEATLNWLERNGLGWAKKEKRVLFPQPSDKDKVLFKSRAVKKLALHIVIEDYANILRTYVHHH